MKKVYAVAAALLFGGMAFAQSSMELPNVPKSQHQRVESSITPRMTTPMVQSPVGPVVQKSAPTVYFSDDFSNPANWAVAHDAGTTGDWVIGSAALSFIGTLNSTSGGDFAGFDSDAAGATATNNAWIQTVNPINLTGVPAVIISWEQVYQRFQDDVFIDVSNNGSTWIPFQVNDDVSTNGATTNPDFRSINISSAAGNQGAVYIRFRFQGAFDYAWAIDDIVVSTPPDHELVFSNAYFNGFADVTSTWHYSQIPVHHSILDTMVFAAAVTNAGAVNQENVTLDVNVTGPVPFSGTSPAGINIMPTDTDSVEVANIYIASQLGNYNVDMVVSADSADEAPANNTISRTFEVTETAYARDFDDFAGGFSYAAGTGIHSLAMLYEIRQEDTITGMQITLFNNAQQQVGTTDGAVVNFHIYDNGLNPIYSNNFVTIDQTWFNNWITVPFDPPFVAQPGVYMVGYEMLSAADEIWIGQGNTPNISPPVTTFVNVDNGGWGWIDATPFVRLNVTEFTDPCAAAVTAEVIDISCNGLTDGELNVSITGGTAPFSYVWSDGSTSEDVNALAAGDYTVTVTFDAANNCVQEATFTVAEPAVLAVDTIVTTSEDCGQADGAATASIGGGTAPYSLAWSNGSTGSSASGLASGTYVVVATDDNGCTASSNVTINGTAAVTGSGTSTNADCGMSNGTATINPATGQAPWGYLWPSGDTTATDTGLAAGTYAVVVTDSLGCMATISVNVSNLNAPVPAIDTTMNALCNGAATGSVTASGTGGTGGLTFVWSTGDSTATTMNLTAGTYTVTVTDSLSCIAITNATVTEPTAVSVTASGTSVSCFNDTDGSATALGTGGTGVISYMWSNGDSTATITGIAGGNYTVDVTDENGCPASATASVSEPAELDASLTGTDVACLGGSNGSVSATVTGGTGTPDYLWSTGANSQLINGLLPGSYTVSVTDDNGCTTTSSTTIGEPASAVSVTVDGTTDDDHLGLGGIQITATGGTVAGAYSYTWSSGSGAEDPNNLTGGATYTVTVTDDNGCTATASAAVIVGIDELARQLFSVYPNPNNGTFNVAFGSETNGRFAMTVTDLVGQVVYSENVSVTGSAVREISLADLSKGVYLLTVEGSDARTVERIVIR